VIDSVVTPHTNPSASGVVRFNEILAHRLGVPFLWVFDDRLLGRARPLFSLKVSELSAAEQQRVGELLAANRWEPEVFLHDWHGLDLERRLLERATRVWCGNRELLEQVRGLHPRAELAWAPGLVLEGRPFPSGALSVFTFGMAHKIRTDMFRRLGALLERVDAGYAVYVSAATHETKSIDDAQAVFDEMRELFGERLFFLGTLSDVAVYNQLRSATYFAAFFERGVRANNTSVAAAMEQGAVVITNLDEYSPEHLVHLETVIDVNRCDELPSDPIVLERIGLAAVQAARVHGWGALAARLRAPD
jgi:hypothetical protein